MKLQQLLYIVEVARHDLNISRAAQNLYTSQPGISKQIRLLEEELDVEIFHRKGKQLVAITETGHEILALAQEIIRKSADIRTLAKEKTNAKTGTLKIATTHTQARYALPQPIASFRARYPELDLDI